MGKQSNLEMSLFEPILVYQKGDSKKKKKLKTELPSNTLNAYLEFQKRFRLLVQKRPDLITNTLSNIFTMRLIGNKTHGDMAEIGIAEFIKQFMYDYESEHVGKDLFRAKEHEEDIIVVNSLSQERIPISLKAYGDGPLQLSTNKESDMFALLQKYGGKIEDKTILSKILSSKTFSSLNFVNVMPLIYREKEMECNIMIFDFEKMKSCTQRILLIKENERFDHETNKVVPGKGRSHPIYMFLDANNNYICEVRYGNASANALQRGLWTHTKNAIEYFNSLTGWISYSHNLTLIELFRLALNSTQKGHNAANIILQEDINNLITSQK